MRPKVNSKIHQFLSYTPMGGLFLLNSFRDKNRIQVLEMLRFYSLEQNVLWCSNQSEEIRLASWRKKLVNKMSDAPNRFFLLETREERLQTGHKSFSSLKTKHAPLWNCIVFCKKKSEKISKLSRKRQ